MTFFTYSDESQEKADMRAPITKRLLTQCSRRISAPGASWGGGEAYDLPVESEVLPRGTTLSIIDALPTAPPFATFTTKGIACVPRPLQPCSGAVSLTDMLNDPDDHLEWSTFRAKYEARYLGAFDAQVVELATRRAPHAIARLACVLVRSNPRHVAKILDVFGKVGFVIAEYTTRAEARCLSAMLTFGELGPSGSQWLFNEIQRQLIDWSCACCGSVNSAEALTCKGCSACSHLWACAGCRIWNRGTVSQCIGCGGSIKREQFLAFRWQCGSCTFINPTASLTCLRCTSSIPLAVSEPVCCNCGAVTSRSCFPWCQRCGHPDPSSNLRLWKCLWCKSAQPSALNSCQGCGEPRVGGNTLAWSNWRCRDCDEYNAPWAGKCQRCGCGRRMAPDTKMGLKRCKDCDSVCDSGDVCALCGGEAPWVCLEEACATLNSPHASVCRRCGSTPSLRVSDDALEWKGYAVPTNVAALVQASPNCRSCGTASMFSVVCTVCGALQQPRTHLGAWLLMKALHDSCQADSLDTGLLGIIEAATSALCAMEGRLAPWAGVDIETGEATESPSSPVTLDGKRHFGIRTLRDIILSLVHHAKGETSFKSRLVDCALSLVEMSNRTTDFDEIGYDVLAALALCVRPDDHHQIDEEMRLRYLIKTKLTKEDIMHGTV